MEEQAKQDRTVRKVVILVGCAFAALFVAMVAVMAVRGMSTQAGEPDRLVTYTYSPNAHSVAYSPNAHGVAFVPAREAPVGSGSPSGLLPVRYRTTRDPGRASFSYTFDATTGSLEPILQLSGGYTFVYDGEHLHLTPRSQAAGNTVKKANPTETKSPEETKK